MTTPVRCDKHMFDDATGMCRSCRRPYCADCLVYTHGAKRAPLCVPCALSAAGVRSTGSVRTQSGSSTTSVATKLMVGLASTAAAAAVAIPALSHLH
jgi:hypothetical protein